MIGVFRVHKNLKNYLIIASSDFSFMHAIRKSELDIPTLLVGALNDSVIRETVRPIADFILRMFSEEYCVDCVLSSLSWNLIHRVFGPKVGPMLAGASAVSIEASVVNLKLARSWMLSNFQVVTWNIISRYQELYFTLDFQVAIVKECECE